MGIAEAVVRSIYLCPNEHQENLAKNIVLVGGNCNFPGFKERMYAELRSQLPHLWEVNVFQPDEPITYSWEGGGPLVKIPNFNSYLVTRAEYEELGSAIIQQRFNTWMTDNSEVKEEPEKVGKGYCYLERLKGRSIFGKQEPGDEDSPTQSEGKSSNVAPDSTEDGNTKETTGSEQQVSQDGVQAGESDCLKQKKVALKNNESLCDLEDESSGSDDLTNSVEIFPFGTGSYL
ncbi:hypothetical protein JTB14_006221 [Gonioctena quinquepunctata]|nr:hypothetical protein JTB14_006221 [Gonioctena quinquepunctata]